MKTKSRFTADDVQDALELAKPGRMLPIDDQGSMSASGVEAVIHNLAALAESYVSIRAERDRLREERDEWKNRWLSSRDAIQEVVHLREDKRELLDALNDLLDYPLVRTSQGFPNSGYTPDWTRRIDKARAAIAKHTKAI